MFMTWNSHGSLITIKFSDGRETVWPCKLWSRSGDVVNDSIFDVFNKYWATAPAAHRTAAETEMLKAFTLFEEDNLDTSPTRLINELKVITANLISLYDWKAFRLWCLTAGEMNASVGIKDELNEIDTNDMTYFTKDYEDLIVMSVMLKTIMPIWGYFEMSARSSIGNQFINLTALEMLRATAIVDLPPFKKLESYIAGFVASRITTQGFSLVNMVGTDEIPDHLMALAIIKKVILFNGRTPDVSIITNVYHVLQQQCKAINNSKPNNKKGKDEKGDDISITDRYKIVQSFPPGIIVLAEHYLENPRKVARHIDPTLDLEIFDKVENDISPDLTISDFHLPLVSGICSAAVNARSMKLVNYVSMVNAIKVAAALTLHWGFPAISGLLINNSEDRDMSKITLSSSTQHRSFALKTELNKELTELYKYPTNKHPGNVLMEQIVTEINSKDWEVDPEMFKELRNEIARLLIKLGK